MDIDPQLVKEATPGALGALSAALLIKGPWQMRAATVLPGAALSYYAAPYFAGTVGMPEGMSGFLLGLFGMAFVAKVFDTWHSLALGEIASRWLAKLLGIAHHNKEGEQ